MHILFPPETTLKQVRDETEEYMHPNMLPWAVVVPGYLTKESCERIINEYKDVEPYSFHGCDATTRECSRPLSPWLDSIHILANKINSEYWNYDIDPDPAAWMQYYEVGDGYQLHMDGAMAQTRKLTAVALLSDGDSYSGGDLALYVHPATFYVPRDVGTVVIFPHWVMHRVYELTRGIRYSLNMGFWGPDWR